MMELAHSRSLPTKKSAFQKKADPSIVGETGFERQSRGADTAKSEAHRDNSVRATTIKEYQPTQFDGLRVADLLVESEMMELAHSRSLPTKKSA